MTKRARSVVAAATSAEMPGFIKPQLATLKAKAPTGDQWLHEIKFDGYRVQVHLNKGTERVEATVTAVVNWRCSRSHSAFLLGSPI